MTASSVVSYLVGSKAAHSQRRYLRRGNYGNAHSLRHHLRLGNYGNGVFVDVFSCRSFLGIFAVCAEIICKLVLTKLLLFISGCSWSVTIGTVVHSLLPIS